MKRLMGEGTHHLALNSPLSCSASIVGAALFACIAGDVNCVCILTGLDAASWFSLPLFIAKVLTRFHSGNYCAVKSLSILRMQISSDGE